MASLADGKRVQMKVIDGADHFFRDLNADDAVEAIDAFLNTGERQSSIEVWGPAEDSWPEWSTPGDPPANRPAG